MATPVKNYTNPTNGPLRWLHEAVVVVPGVVPAPPYPRAGQVIATTTISGVKIPLRGLSGAPHSVPVQETSTPTPPMGTLKLATFPAIYTSGRRTRPTTGQLWPRTR